MAFFNSENPGDAPRRRRPRYAGTHPKRFEEKYKEHAIDAHPELLQRLRDKGKTPAGSHIPVLTEEIMECLNPTAGQIVADCTLGYGGHTMEFSKRIGAAGKIIALDIDAEQLGKTKTRLAGLETPIHFHRSNFAGLANIMQKEGLDGFDIIFADLGVSSMQIDDPSRGFSYKHDGPLDMRMDNRRKLTAADILNTASREELDEAFLTFADESDHQAIAERIAAVREKTAFAAIGQLVELIFEVKGIDYIEWKQLNRLRPGGLHPAARVFLALRIMVNDELGTLKQILRIAPFCLKSGGRIGIISFHSKEDRIVKKAFAEGYKEGLYQSTSKEIIVPAEKEIASNPRSASAKFRWAIRL